MKKFILGLLTKFKQTSKHSPDLSKTKETYFQKYCSENPWAPECRIYEV